MPLNIQLQAAKQAIDLPNFQRDDLLTVALTEPADLHASGLPTAEQARQASLARRLALLGESLFNTVLADYLCHRNPDLTQIDLDYWRHATADQQAFTAFAVDLGLPQFSSSCHKPHRLPPSAAPRLWAAMFEAVVGSVFLDRERNFATLADWVDERFLQPSIGDPTAAPDYHLSLATGTARDYLDTVGLDGD